MATQLAIYNDALIEMGDRPLSSLSENTEARRILDQAYSSVVAHCLEAGLWNFAKRTVRLDSDTSITPAFGPGEVFAKPDDWVRTMAMSYDDQFRAPLVEYTDETSYWVADATPIYLQYVSDDASYGNNLDRWPESFTRFVVYELAMRTCTRITQNASKKDDLEKSRDRALRRAKNRDAMNENQPKFAPMGSWNRARGGGTTERGRTDRLIG